MVYTIASPDEYLAITGAGIKTLKIVKSAWVWPFQRVSHSRRSCVLPMLRIRSANVSAFSRTIIV
jgi:hypothetical protein